MDSQLGRAAGAVQSPSKENTGAVIVTFHPDSGFAERVASILPQVNRLVIVDNHSDADELSMLQGIANNPSVELVLNDRNLGVATALNQGVNRVKESGHQWALLFDQDSAAYPMMVTRFAQVYDAIDSREKIGLIGTYYWDGDLYGIQPFIQPFDGFGGRIWKECAFMITSGTLVSVDAFNKIGPFRDDFFVDTVDLEYCYRAREYGYLVVAARGPWMEHSVGSPDIYRFGGRTYTVTNHSPLRRYYMMRNCTVVQDEYRHKNREVYEFMKVNKREIFKVVLLFERQKIAKMYMMLLGILHARRGRMGEFR